MRENNPEDKRIKLGDTIADVVLKMSEGNPGATRVCMELLSQNDGITYLLGLDNLGIYGVLIWVAYNDYASMDLNKLKHAIIYSVPEMLTLLMSYKNILRDHEK